MQIDRAVRFLYPHSALFVCGAVQRKISCQLAIGKTQVYVCRGTELLYRFAFSCKVEAGWKYTSPSESWDRGCPGLHNATDVITSYLPLHTGGKDQGTSN